MLGEIKRQESHMLLTKLSSTQTQISNTTLGLLKLTSESPETREARSNKTEGSLKD
jgi:hypothetical protein